MIQTEKQHAITIHQLMMSINRKCQIEYHPWKKSITLRANEKQIIIDNAKQWNTVFKSIVVDGF
jgi:glycerol-3-phosphate O-acyltransferase